MEEENAENNKVPGRTWRRDVCFGCGPANPSGLHLKFEVGADGQSYVCEFQVSGTFTGPPGHAHGGIIATILDEAMGKANKLKGVVALTRRMEIEYFRPVPIDVPLVAEGRVLRMEGRELHNSGEIRNASGAVLARSRGTFITIDPERMFAKEMERERTQAKS